MESSARDGGTEGGGGGPTLGQIRRKNHSHTNSQKWKWYKVTAKEKETKKPDACKKARSIRGDEKDKGTFNHRAKKKREKLETKKRL